MVGAACERVMDHQIMIPWPISTVDTSNKDQALVMDLRKKDVIYNINVIRIVLWLSLQPTWLFPQNSFRKTLSAKLFLQTALNQIRE